MNYAEQQERHVTAQCIYAFTIKFSNRKLKKYNILQSSLIENALTRHESEYFAIGEYGAQNGLHYHGVIYSTEEYGDIRRSIVRNLNKFGNLHLTKLPDLGNFVSWMRYLHKDAYRPRDSEEIRKEDVTDDSPESVIHTEPGRIHGNLKFYNTLHDLYNLNT